jgi:hypothetical protein
VVAAMAATIIIAGVNITNILQAEFLYKNALRSFSLITVFLCIFLSKEFSRKG